MNALLRSWLNFKVALGSLGARPARTMLTLLGIVIGIVALVVMMSLTHALDTSVRLALAPLGANTFQVQREPVMMRSSAQAKLAMRRKPFTIADVKRLEERLTSVTAVAGEMWGWGNKISTAEHQTAPMASVVGAMPPFMDANGMNLAAGRFLGQYDLDYRRHVAVIAPDIVKELFRGGNDEAIGSTIRIKDVPFEVIGVFAPQPPLFGMPLRNTTVAIPVTIFEKLMGFKSMHVTFLVRDPAELPRAEEETIAALRWMRGVPPGEPNDFEVFTNASVSGWLDTLSMAISTASGGICLIALLVGGIGVMNIMLVSVTERTREIGIRKALGARPSTILGQFIAEAVLLAGLGGAIGAGLAEGMVIGVGMLLHLPVTVPLWAVVVALGSSSAIGLIAGIYPAARAARLNPIDALRYE